MNVHKLSRHALLTSGLVLAGALGPATSKAELTVRNGWLVQDGKAIIGYMHENDWWGGMDPALVPPERSVPKWVKLETMQLPSVNISRRYPDVTGPGRTEDLERLAETLAREKVQGYEHFYGLWPDRRRDTHYTGSMPLQTEHPERPWDNPIPPFYELPWARSGQGVAYDGGTLYDLTRFNEWYFDRMETFARQGSQQGLVFLYGLYNQHNILEHKSHYADFPWNPTNSLQVTGMPPMPEERRVMAHAAFYDVTDPVRADLHRAYFRKCLDVLGRHEGVIFSLGFEFTGPASFVRFWLDEVAAWEKEHGRNVLISLVGTKDVQDEILADEHYAQGVDVIDLRGWWYASNGLLLAPKSSPKLAGRYRNGLVNTTAQSLYRQVFECRLRYPNKALLHAWPGPDVEKNMALFMGGASLLSRDLFPKLPPSSTYETLHFDSPLKGFMNFISDNKISMSDLIPQPDWVDAPDQWWCLGDPNGDTILIYASQSGELRVKRHGAQRTIRWLDPVTGEWTEQGKTQGTEEWVIPAEKGKLLWL